MKVLLDGNICRTPRTGVDESLIRYYENLSGEWVDPKTVPKTAEEMLPTWYKIESVDGLEVCSGYYQGIPSSSFTVHTFNGPHITELIKERNTFNKTISNLNLQLLKNLLLSNPSASTEVVRLYQSYQTAEALGLTKTELIALANNEINSQGEGPVKTCLEAIKKNLENLWEKY